MKLSGEYAFNAPPETIYRLMQDPDTLMTCLPGCEALELIGENEYAATMTIGVAMIKGRYNGKVRISDQVEPTSFKMLIEGKGPQGQVSGEGLIEISATPEGSLVTWSGDPKISGTLARIGSRVIQPAAKMIVGHFFKCLEQQATVESSAS